MQARGLPASLERDAATSFNYITRNNLATSEFRLRVSSPEVMSYFRLPRREKCSWFYKEDGNKLFKILSSSNTLIIILILVSKLKSIT